MCAAVASESGFMLERVRSVPARRIVLVSVHCQTADWKLGIETVSNIWDKIMKRVDNMLEVWCYVTFVLYICR